MTASLGKRFFAAELSTTVLSLNVLSFSTKVDRSYLSKAYYILKRIHMIVYRSTKSSGSGLCALCLV